MLIYPGDRPSVYYSTLYIWTPHLASFSELDSSITNVLAPNEALFVTENTVEHTNAKFRNEVTSVRWCAQQNVKTTAKQLHFPHEADHIISYSYELVTLFIT